MLATALHAAWTRRRRLVGIIVAVGLGVAFLAATSIVGSSARSAFGHQFSVAGADIDTVVRSAQERTGGAEDARPPVPADLVDEVSGVDGVAGASPLVEGTAQLVDAGGHPVTGGDALAQNWIDDTRLTAWRLVDGRAPAAAGEVVVDRASAETADLNVGDDTTVLVPDAVPATIVGVAAFGDEDSRPGSTFVAFGTDEAQRRLLGNDDLVSAVLVAGDGALDQAALVERVGAVLPDEVEAVTGEAHVAEQRDEVEGDLVDALTTGLLAFALVALVVAAVGIANTFSILAAQRVRESALFRALGATRRQVLGGALVEAVLVGLAGSVLGTVAGLVVALGLLAAMAAIGFDLPVDGLVVAGGDVVTAVLVGVVVTVVAALPAAWRAANVAPVVALREAEPDEADPTGLRRARRRAVVGAVAAVVGVVLVVAGGGGAMGLVAIGAVLVVVGLVALGPAAVGPVCAAVGPRLTRSGLAGELAARNVARSPRRSAAAASALLVGVGVVSLFAVFGASAARSVDEGVRRAFAGDVALTPSTDAGALGASTVDAVDALPEVAGAVGVGRGAGVLEGIQDDLAYAELDDLPAVVDLDLVDGDPVGETASTIDSATDDRRLLVSADLAEERGWSVGDAVGVGLPDGTTSELTLVATYRSEAVVGDAIVGASIWAAHAGRLDYSVVVVDLADGVSPAAGREAVAAATAGPGAPEVLDREGFVAAEVDEVSSVVDLAYGLLVIAIVIALVGIANTMSLAVHERSRELGLLRAVGQERSQLRAMVRWESVLLAVFGTAVGVAAGVFIGWGVVRSVAARADIATFTLPVLPLVAVLVVGVLVGVLAAARPAAVASRRPVLDALATR